MPDGPVALEVVGYLPLWATDVLFRPGLLGVGESVSSGLAEAHRWTRYRDRRGRRRCERGTYRNGFGAGYEDGGRPHQVVRVLPGCALRLRDRHHRRYLRRSLGSGGTAAPERESLALLPSGPDAVRTLPVRGTRSSTLRAQTLSRRTVPRTAFGPAWSGFRVQGTADSPPSATGQAERSKAARLQHRGQVPFVAHDLRATTGPDPLSPST